MPSDSLNHTKTRTEGTDTTTRVRVKILAPETTPYRCLSHAGLEAIIATETGKHAATAGRELRMACGRYLRDGTFRINSRAFVAIHGRRAYDTLVRMMHQCTRVVTNHSPGNSAARRVFTLAGVEKNPEKRSGYRGPGSKYILPEHLQRWTTIPAEWMVERNQKWTAYCRENDIPQNVDIDGSTDWGAAARHAVETAEIPAVSVAENQEAGQQQTDRLTVSGVVNVVVRRFGRMYSALTQLNRADRNEVRFAGEATGEVDMRACFTALLAAKLPKRACDAVVGKIKSGAWYRQFDEVYASFAAAKRREKRADGASDDDIVDRLRGAKVEFQRQCMFTRDLRADENPMWAVLHRNHPEFAELTRRLNAQFGPSGFAKMMMQMESEIFVDRVIPRLHREGITVLGIHDGLVVAEQHLERTREVLSSVCQAVLGFIPGISVKGNRRVAEAQSSEPELCAA